MFQAKGNDASRLSRNISTAIKKDHGFGPFVLLLEAADLKKAILGNPFPDAESDPKTLHVDFISSAPLNPDMEMLESLRRETERFALKDAVFYLHAPEGIGRSKLAANAEKLIGVSMTDRNWRTVSKLNDMVEELI